MVSSTGPKKGVSHHSRCYSCLVFVHDLRLMSIIRHIHPRENPMSSAFIYGGFDLTFRSPKARFCKKKKNEVDLCGKLKPCFFVTIRSAPNYFYMKQC